MIMKNTFLFCTLFLGLNFILAQQAPEHNKTTFDEKALLQPIFDLDGQTTSVQAIFEKHQGKIILLDVWASWCPDCITGLPELKQVQKDYPEVVYLFFSLDRVGKEAAWKNAIEKFNIEGEHYWFNTEWKNDFTEFIELNWVPRYVLIDQDGKIAHYYAVKADDLELIKKLKELISS